MKKQIILIALLVLVLSLKSKANEKNDENLSISFQLQYAEAVILEQSLKSGFSNETREKRFVKLLFGLYLCTGNNFGKVIENFKFDQKYLKFCDDALGWGDYFDANGTVKQSGPYLLMSVEGKGVLSSQVYNDQEITISNNQEFLLEQLKFKKLCSSLVLNKSHQPPHARKVKM